LLIFSCSRNRRPIDDRVSFLLHDKQTPREQNASTIAARVIMTALSYAVFASKEQEGIRPDKLQLAVVNVQLASER
jgi:hypothetical protein